MVNSLKRCVGVAALALAGLWLVAPRDHPTTEPLSKREVLVAKATPINSSSLPSSRALDADVPADVEVPSRPSTDAFAAWIKKAGFTNAAADSKPKLSVDESAQGEALARARRVELAELIRVDPQRALALAVSVAVRSHLPASITQHLEERVSGRGSLGVLVATDFDRGVAEVRREVVIGDRRFDAFVYGRRATQVTQQDVALHGIAVGSLLAVAEEAARPLEPGEVVPAEAERKLCPVSARPANINATPAFAEVGGRIESFCGTRHLELFNAQLVANDGGSSGNAGGGSGDGLRAADAWSQGPKTCLFMRAAFPDDPTEPITEDGAYALMDGVNQWFVETSYDTTSIIPTVTPLLMLPQTKAWYSAQGTSRLLADARDAARDAGFDTDQYHWDVVRHTSVPGFSFGGLAFIRGKGMWLQSSSVGVACHEFGHNYGLSHANSWTANNDAVIGPGSHTEYGNTFDTMGSAVAANNHFNALFKNQLDWLPDPFVASVAADGVYRVWAFDGPGIVTGRKYALRVRKDYDRDYWMEFRQKFNNRWLRDGVLLNWSPWNNGVVGSAGGTHLLDTTPGTPDGKNDAALTIGRTFSDRAAWVHLTPVARSTSGSDAWIDIVVKRGQFPENQPPSATLTADRLSVNATGAVVNFFVQAADPDGDALAYAWDFGDATFGPNTPNASKAWGTNGEFVVRCTVSDMKGGLVSRQLLIAVGTVNGFRLAGRIVTTAGVPLEGVRVHNGQSGAAYRGTYTDSDGAYTLVNLPAGAHVISAVKYGFQLAHPGGTAVTVGPSVSGFDWVATADPVVSIVATDAEASETTGDPGVFTISRVGPTNVALTVKFNRTGRATVGTDYTNSPTLNGTPLQLVLPAGVAAVNVNVQPLPDALSEGTETVTLTLMEDAAYVLGRAEATVTIRDNGAPTRPNVRISATTPGGPADNFAPESGDDSGAFTFTRTGATDGELTIFYTVAGTATMGVDYVGLPGVVTIPPGETTTAVPFRVIDDIDVEGNESVIVTLVADVAYSGGGDSATITIGDDDPPTVTITATDGTAREAGGNAAAFTVTRQGSLGANLLVNYEVSGTAMNGADFNALPGTVTIPAGRASAAISLAPRNDAEFEGDETVRLTLTATTAYNVGTPGTATVTIIDDEQPSVTLIATDNTAHETDTAPGRWTFTRIGPTNEPLAVFFHVSGTALSGADFVALGDSITIPAGASNAVLVLTPIDDAVREADETVRVSLWPRPEYSVATAAPQTVTIKDNDTGLPGVRFTFAASSGPESDVAPRLSVTLSTNASAPVTVRYAVTGGSATGGGRDFTLASGTLTFAAGAVNQSIAFSVNNDTLPEADETIEVTLSNPSGAVLDAITSHVYTIIDDDGSGAVSVTAVDPAASESGPDPGRLRIARAVAATNDLTVFFQITGSASAPSDFAPLPNSVTIPAGSNAVELVVLPVDDATDETNEVVTLNLLPGPGYKLGTATATITITDNDDSRSLPVVRVEATDANAAEPGTDTGEFTFTRDGATNEALTVQFTVTGSATSGTDFLPFGTSATFSPGATRTTLVVTPRDDSRYESNETVVVTLTARDGYRVGLASSATVTIADDETGVTIATSGTAREGGGSTGAFVITRMGSTVSNLVVNFAVAGTAEAALDYVPLGSVAEIPAGTNAVALPVITRQDVLPEGTETIVATLLPGPAYTVATPSSATLLLLDDEPAVSIAATDARAYEAGGDDGSFTITRHGATNTDLTVRLAFGGTARNGFDYATLSNAVQLLAGQASTMIRIVPLNDDETEGAETVELTLEPDAAYVIVTPASAVVTIADDEVNAVPVVAITSPARDLVYLSGTNGLLVLEGVAADDGKPNPPGALTTMWMRASGPDAVSFADVAALHTTAHFASNGLFVLRLTASDGSLTGAEELRVVVGGDQRSATNVAPTVDAGPAQAVPLGTTVTLAGQASDDGFPFGTLTTMWRQLSGPSTATFTDLTNVTDSVIFSDAGVYVLRLTASDGDVQVASDVTITVVAPTVVSLTAPGPNASEIPLTQEGAGYFVIERTGDLDSELTVQLAIGGTASNGVDYVDLPAEVTLAAGAATHLLFVRAVSDGRPEGNETVELSVRPDAAYLIGPSNQATVTLLDAPWDAWRWTNFSSVEITNSGAISEYADPDADHWNNLLEYAFGRDPKSVEIESTAGLRGGLEPADPGEAAPVFVVEFPRRKSPTDVIYELEVSDDLETWFTGGGFATELPPVPCPGNGLMETARYEVSAKSLFGGPTLAPSPRFARLKIRLRSGPAASQTQ